MNRPLLENYTSEDGNINFSLYSFNMCKYCNTLEERCNALEKANDEYQNAQHLLFMAMCKYKKALDKACEKLEYCSKERGVFNAICNREYWKNKFLKEVQDE